MRHKHRAAKRRVALGLSAAAIAYAVVHGRLRRYEIVELSMQPALDPGDFVIALPMRDICRGEIVILEHPNVANFQLVKRIVGLPGELVTIHNGQTHMDGGVLAERWADGPTFPDGEWQLGPGEVFVLGDNRAASSADARTLGPIPGETIRWRVVARYWPLRTAGRIMP
jgi:signal peptidase I